jgi:malate dehydrogenase
MDLVPLWSTVRISGLDAAERRVAVDRLRGRRSLDALDAEITAAQGELLARDVADAFELIDAYPPDLRAVTRPWLTHTSGAKTATGTASATVDLVETVLDGREIVVAGQVLLDGEVELGGRALRGVLGAPVVLGPEGWTRVLLDDLAADETARLLGCADRIAASLRTWGVQP